MSFSAARQRNVLLAEDPLFNIHLQWFAPEDEGRTEEPTESKIREAREEGKVVKSGEITSAIVMLFGLIFILLFSGMTLSIVADMMRYYFTKGFSSGLEQQAVTAFWVYLIRLVLPVMGICFLAAFMGDAVQVGFHFTSKPITPDFQRIQPNFGRWASRAFLSPEALFNLFKSISKVAIISILAWMNIKLELPNLVNPGRITLLGGLSIVSRAALRLMLATAILFLFFAIFDYLFQRWMHRQSLKMTRHEVKEDIKRFEGDPLIKSRLRQRMRELLASAAERVVPQSDVVITNPTHYAVAIKWDEYYMQYPAVMAKGVDEVALRIREVARRSDVPVVENKPLARALYANVAVGDEIPYEYMDIVGEILVEVYRMSGKIVQG